jgi:hypothetical protein
MMDVRYLFPESATQTDEKHCAAPRVRHSRHAHRVILSTGCVLIAFPGPPSTSTKKPVRSGSTPAVNRSDTGTANGSCFDTDR